MQYRHFAGAVLLGAASLLTALPVLANPATDDAPKPNFDHAGHVITVMDGSHFRIARIGGGEIRVRIACKDAYQKQDLSKQILGQEVQIKTVGWDDDGAMVSKVRVQKDGKNVWLKKLLQGS